MIWAMASNVWRGTLRFREKSGRETHITELRTSTADGSVPDLPLSLLVYHSHLLSLPVANQRYQHCELICCEPAHAKEWTGFLKHLRSANKAARVDVPGAALWIQPSSRDQQTAGCFRQSLGAKDIFALDRSIGQSILEGAAINEGNCALNRMALVGCCWHNVLAPPAGACIPALTRRVTLGEPDLLAVAQIARPWWRCVRAQPDATNAGLASLAAGCTAITTLNLHGCRQIGDAGLKSLAAGCTAITTLNLSGCRQIGDAGLASLAAGCTAITTLNLGCCRHIGDAGLASLAAGCTAITTLNFTWCDQIGDAGLKSLAAGCTAITTLNLHGCHRIGDAGLASVAAKYPNIQINK